MTDNCARLMAVVAIFMALVNEYTAYVEHENFAKRIAVLESRK